MVVIYKDLFKDCTLVYVLTVLVNCNPLLVIPAEGPVVAEVVEGPVVAADEGRDIVNLL